MSRAVSTWQVICSASLYQSLSYLVNHVCWNACVKLLAHVFPYSLNAVLLWSCARFTWDKWIDNFDVAPRWFGHFFLSNRSTLRLSKWEKRKEEEEKAKLPLLIRLHALLLELLIQACLVHFFIRYSKHLSLNMEALKGL